VANLRNLETPPNNIRTFQGTIVQSAPGATTLAVNVLGNVLPARWADPLVVAVGDTVLVEVSGDRQGEAFVKSRLTNGPRPSQGTVTTVPPSSPTITVTGTDGIAYTATFAYASPAVNDVVILSWNAAIPTALAIVTTTTPLPGTAPPPIAAPPGQNQTDTSAYQATDSDTYWPAGGWGSWAGGGGNVYQGGASYGGPVYGAWFYSGSPTELAGRTIAGLRLRIGSRRPVGANNSPVTLHVYTHTSPNKPGGNVSLVDGPFDFVIQPGAGPQTLALPTGCAPTLLGGGGIAIVGENYAGVNGRLIQPDSGTLYFDWQR
jgi:hypothetical protein